ncbi:MAG: carboxypeptidase-like regulatory domain-containing protein, partial [Cytophagales bacterium]|nr:carboxypeptidase-like regulatory domain-containing protein [Cytophagales bacterium]
MKHKYVVLLLLLLSCCVQNLAQAQLQHTVKGIVTDAESGEPLIGVNVLLKNTTSGVVTNYEGQYKFGGLTADNILVFSYIGYDPQEIPVGAKSIVDVQLKSSAQALEAIVVFGESQKDVRSITG